MWRPSPTSAGWSCSSLIASCVWSAPICAALVTVAGSLQSELGCPGDWQPDCADTHITYDAEDDVWQDTFAIPAGNYEYKAAINDSWDENYGANAIPGGPNIPLTAPGGDVKFYFDDKSNWVTDNVNAVIASGTSFSVSSRLVAVTMISSTCCDWAGRLVASSAADTAMATAER